ncbi:MAG TPA: ParA family partition ATPase [Paracoccaceae bacterium]|nr:ParA family partition ATPase [Paracoccaceae bacterium]
MVHVLTVAQQKGGSGKTTLAVNLGVELTRRGLRVALLDTDPQGSLGRWFMTRRDRGLTDMDFSTASAWGVGYEAEKLKRSNDVVLIDTPPKIDSDLRPALREASLILVPVATSHVDLWATDGVLDLAARVGKPTLLVLNRAKAGTRLVEEIAAAAAELSPDVAAARLGQRVAYAETLGQGLGVADAGRGPAAAEAAVLTDEILVRLAG